LKLEVWQQVVNLLLFLLALKLKNKIKTVGVARQQRHFLCSDKENEAKESFLLAEGYVRHGAAATAI
jgi:hypothetical protein